MKIRITQSGYETFCGLLGDVKFESGVSVSEVSDQQAAYVGAMFITETFESEETVDQDAAAKVAEAERLAAEAERERAEAEAAEAAAQAAAEEAAEAQDKEATE